MERQPRINQAILAPKVLLISDRGENLGVVSRDQALVLAYEDEIDLVEIGPNATPPVCKLIDYSKYRYQQERKLRKQKAKVKAGGIKEVKLSLNISPHDFETKLKKAREFLAKGHKVRTFMLLRGREKGFVEETKGQFEKFRTDLGAEYDLGFQKFGSRVQMTLKKGKNAQIKNS